MYAEWHTRKTENERRKKNKIVEKISFTKHSHRNSGALYDIETEVWTISKKNIFLSRKNSKRFEWKLSYVVPSIKLNVCKAFIERRMGNDCEPLQPPVSDPSQGNFNCQLKRKMNLCLRLFTQIYQRSSWAMHRRSEAIWLIRNPPMNIWIRRHPMGFSD